MPARAMERMQCEQIELLYRLQEYITDETNDSIYYYRLAEMAMTPEDRAIILGFAEDEARHAANFQILYRLISRTIPPEPVIVEPNITDFEEAIRIRILAESGDFRKYANDYAKYNQPPICDLFYLTSVSEGQHAMRLTLFLEN